MSVWRAAALFRAAVVAVVVGLLVGCSTEAPRARSPSTRSGSTVEFAYGTPQGEVLSSASTRGRVTALLFVTTFDLPSQVMAKRLDVVTRRHRPRTNAGAIALEAPNDAPLVDVFKSSLDLHYPVGLSNGTAIDRDGPFGTIDRVPTLIVLDARGREVSRSQGILTEREIDEALARAAE